MKCLAVKSRGMAFVKRYNGKPPEWVAASNGFQPPGKLKIISCDERAVTIKIACGTVKGRRCAGMRPACWARSAPDEGGFGGDDKERGSACRGRETKRRPQVRARRPPNWRLRNQAVQTHAENRPAGMASLGERQAGNRAAGAGCVAFFAPGDLLARQRWPRRKPRNTSMSGVTPRPGRSDRVTAPSSSGGIGVAIRSRSGLGLASTST